MKVDIKYCGVPNVCFSLTDKDDEREKLFSEQRMEMGFDDSELWSLDLSIARFIIPRLKRLIEIHEETIVDEHGFMNKCRKFQRALELITKEMDELPVLTDAEEQEIKDGLSIFPEIFRGLWC